MISEGSAFLEGSGRVLAADGGFREAIGSPRGDATEALRNRAVGDPALAAFLAGGGPDVVRLAAGDGSPACELTRVRGERGLLLRAKTRDDELSVPGAAEHAEYAIQAVALARLAGSVAHEVKNSLNAMALQVALLGDKLATSSDALASACEGNLTSLKTQIGRVNEVVRRYLDVSDPPVSGGCDAGSLLADAANLFGHEARRRRIALACEAVPGAVRVSGDPARVARLVLGMLWRAVTGTPEGGKLLARAAPVGAEAVLSIEHRQGTLDPSLAWMGPVMAAAAEDMGGKLEETREADVERAALVLPKERLV